MDDSIISDNKVSEENVKIEELTNAWKRALADYKNLERRCGEEKEAIIKFSNFILLEKLIPVLDNLESLSAHINDKGLEIITKQLTTILTDEGVEEIKAMGEDFNPMFMEASEMVEGEENKVIEVVLKGFKLQEKILRPARVKVGKKN